MASDHDKRLMRSLQCDDSPAPVDAGSEEFAPEPPAHTPAAGVVLAAAETIEALILNGMNVEKLRSVLFALFSYYAAPYPHLRELVLRWATEGDFDEFRLDELHEYNSLLKQGAIGRDER